jgi:hypothetical protein
MNRRLAEVEAELLRRWPENRLEPTLDRIRPCWICWTTRSAGSPPST